MINSTLTNANILIVDDQPANIDVLEGFLEMQGYINIETTTDPREVVALFNLFKPDLILLDLSMPYLSGFEVMAQLKPLVRPGTFLPILVLTADVTTEAKQHALSAGASDFLTKPFDLVEVGLRIKNLLFSSYLLFQSVNQNLILEEKVKQRTAELEKINIDLTVARAKAEASDKLKTAFLNNISHEIRTPLNGILGFAPMAINPSVSYADKLVFLDILNVSGKRLMQTVTDYMDISLIVSGNMEVLNEEFIAADMIDEIKEGFEPVCKSKKLTLYVDNSVDINSLIINSDRELLNRILAHLLDNAVKFTLEGEITLGIRIRNNSLEFFVSDTGIGIDPDALLSVFDAFTQEDTSNTRGHEGSGLGLAIVKGLVSLLGGTVRVESVKERGSTFYINIPYKPGFSMPVITEKPALDEKPFRRPVILVAEDEPIGLLFLELSLSSDYEILRAEDGEEAVKLCHLVPEIQLVLMDIKMPKMNGIIATQEIKKIREKLPVIAFTAYAEAGERNKCIAAGCDEYLSKPATKEALLALLAKFDFYK